MNRRKKVEHSSSSFRDEVLLERLYKKHYQALLDYANSILNSEDVAQDIIQDLFVHLLLTRSEAPITKSYLYTSVRNRAFDILRGEKVRQSWAAEQRLNVTQKDLLHGNAEETLHEKELEKRIEHVLLDMPERRRRDFSAGQVSRFYL